MFCRNCGESIANDKKFCSHCGTSTNTVSSTPIHNISTTTDTWWHRLAKVFYVLLHIPLPFILLSVWMEASESYDYTLKSYQNNYSDAFWAVLIVLIIYVIILRGLKLIYQYIVLAKKPEFKKEIKKLY